MSNVLMMVIRVLTFLTTLFCLGLTGWSLFTGQPVLLTLVGAMLSAGFGFFVYKDAKKVFGK